jgi:hypothetical protein
MRRIMQFRLRTLFIFVGCVAVFIWFGDACRRHYGYINANREYAETTSLVAVMMKPPMDQLTASEELYSREMSICWSIDARRHASEDRVRRLREMEVHWQAWVDMRMWGTGGREDMIKDLARLRDVLTSAEREDHQLHAH